MRTGKLFAALLVACVEHRTVGQYDAGGHEHAVAIGMHAAVHARSVVHHDTAHHCRAYRRRVWWEHAPVGT